MCDTYEDANEMAGLLTEVVSCKKAAIVTMFFLYLVYITITGLIYLFEHRKQEERVKILKAIKIDLEQRQFFIIAITLLIQVITPVPFPVVMLYLYMLTIPVMIIGQFKQKDKWQIYFAAIAIQKLFVLILIFFVLINPWCRHYYYRYIVGEPPSTFYKVTVDTSTTTTTASNSDTTSNNGNGNAGGAENSGNQ